MMNVWANDEELCVARRRAVEESCKHYGITSKDRGSIERALLWAKIFCTRRTSYDEMLTVVDTALSGSVEFYQSPERWFTGLVHPLDYRRK